MKRLQMICVFLFLILVVVILSPSVQFALGGAFINIGYRFQDHIRHGIDGIENDLTPDEIHSHFVDRNKASASVRELFPRKEHHPQIAILACMDARLDTNEITGDTRRLYYVLRSAGSTMDLAQQEMLELAVVNGVKVLILTTHTDCSAEKVASDKKQRVHFPHLTRQVGERSWRIQEFLNRTLISNKIAKGELVVKMGQVDSETGLILFPEAIKGKSE